MALKGFLSNVLNQVKSFEDGFKGAGSALGDGYDNTTNDAKAYIAPHKEDSPLEEHKDYQKSAKGEKLQDIKDAPSVEKVNVDVQRVETGNAGVDAALDELRVAFISRLKGTHEALSTQINFIHGQIGILNKNIQRIDHQVDGMPSIHDYRAISNRLQKIETKRDLDIKHASFDFKNKELEKKGPEKVDGDGGISPIAAAGAGLLGGGAAAASAMFLKRLAPLLIRAAPWVAVGALAWDMTTWDEESITKRLQELEKTKKDSWLRKERRGLLDMWTDPDNEKDLAPNLFEEWFGSWGEEE